MAEYEACIAGVLMAVEHQVKKLKVFGDFALVIYQLRGEWETRDPKLIPCHNYIKEMSECFDRITFHYIPWDENQMEYLQKGAYPQGVTENDKRTLRRLAASFFLRELILYKRSTDLTLLYRMDDREANEIIEEVHEEIFGTHTNGHALA
ncbi:hypothetical protein CR513_52374, partial [Mucuna pruriens]